MTEQTAAEVKATQKLIAKEFAKTDAGKLAASKKAHAKSKADLKAANKELAETSAKLEQALQSQGGTSHLEGAVNNAIMLIQSYVVLAGVRKTSTVQLDEVRLIGQLLIGKANQSADLMMLGVDA